MRLHPLSLLTGIVLALRQLATFIVILVVTTLIRGGASDRGAGFELVWLLIVPIVLSLAGSLIRYASTRYEVTPTEVVFDTGVVWKQRRVIPRDRVQEVHLTQSLVHRLLGLVRVKIESAAAGNTEIDLDALGEEEAHALRNTLTGAHGPSVYVRPTPPAYEVGTGRIVFASMLENRAILLLAGLAGAVYPFLDERNVGQLLKLAFHESKSVPVGTWLALAAGIYLAGWVFSGLLGLWTFAGFRIERHPKGILVSYGLGVRTQRVLRTARIQEATVSQGVMFRLFRLFQVQARSAGVQSEDQEQKGFGFLSPAATEDELPVLVDLVFPGIGPLGSGPWNRLPGRSAALRLLRVLPVWAAILAAVRAGVLLAGTVSIVPELKALQQAVQAYALPVVATAAALGLLATVLRAVNERHRLTDRVLVHRVGGIQRRWQSVPANRMQAFRVTQGPLQRAFGLCSASLQVADAACSLEDLPVAEAARIRDRASEARRADPRRGV